LSVTGQFADKPTRSHLSHGLVIVNSQTSQLAEMFDLKFGVYYHFWVDDTVCTLS